LISNTSIWFFLVFFFCSQGVTIASQKRYVQYMETLIARNLVYEPKTLKLEQIKFVNDDGLTDVFDKFGNVFLPH
jgi:hypothetical protein